MKYTVKISDLKSLYVWLGFVRVIVWLVIVNFKVCLNSIYGGSAQLHMSNRLITFYTLYSKCCEFQPAPTAMLWLLV